MANSWKQYQEIEISRQNKIGTSQTCDSTVIDNVYFPQIFKSYHWIQGKAKKQTHDEIDVIF